MTQHYQGYELTDAQADRIGKLRIHNDVEIKTATADAIFLRVQDHGSSTIDSYQLDADGRLKQVWRI